MLKLSKNNIPKQPINHKVQEKEEFIKIENVEKKEN